MHVQPDSSRPPTSRSAKTSTGCGAWRQRGALFSFVILVLVAVGCTPSVSPSPAPTSSGSSGTPQPSESALTATELSAAIKFRDTFGLRSDEAWIRLVSADPASQVGFTKYGVRLSPQEVEDLDTRTVAVEAIKTQVVNYGLAHPDDWAGAYVDQRRGGILVAQFSDNVEQHRLALMSGIGPRAKFEVTSAAFSLEYLQSEAARIRGTDDWFMSIPAYLESYGVDVAANRILIGISSVEPAAQELIERHFGWSGLTKVESDGTGAQLLPFGTVRVEARDSKGAPVTGLSCRAVSDLVGEYEIPPTTTNKQGVCLLRLPATGYWIRLERGSGPPTRVAMERAVVTPGGVTKLAIETP